MATVSKAMKLLITRNDFPAMHLLNDFDVEVWNEERCMPRDELLKRSVGKDALIIMSGNKIDDELLEAAGPKLKIVATHTVGYDHVDIAALKKRNIRLGYTPGVLDDAVAELTVAIMLNCMRRLFEGRDVVIGGKWPQYQPFFWMNGTSLKNSVVGIVGLGRIGYEIAKRLIPFKVKEILYTSRREKQHAREVNARKVEFCDLLKYSDVVVVMCSLTDETRHLFGDKEFMSMKPTAIIVNASRGDVLDQEALIRALKNGTIQGAALDVMNPEPLPPSHELLTLKNCCIVPHLGSAVVATRMEMAELTAHNIIEGLNGRAMPAEVVE